MTVIKAVSEKARKANNNRRRGEAFERAVCLDQERVGRVAFRVRQGGGEPVDIVSINWAAAGQFLIRASGSANSGPTTVYTNDPAAHGFTPVVYFIQCKSGKRGPYIPPAELESLIEKAKMAGAVPMVAWKDGKTIQYKVLS